MNAVASDHEPGLRERALAAVHAAEQAFESGHPEQARELATEAAALALRCTDDPLRGWALMVLGRAEMRLANDLAADAAAGQAHALLQACHDLPRQLWSLNTRATVQLNCGNTDNCVALLRQGLALAAAPGCAAVRCALLINLSNRLHDTGEFGEAVQCLRDAATAADEPPRLPGQALDVASRLALAHIEYALALEADGRKADAHAQRNAAAAALPELDLARWRDFSNSESYALWSQAYTLIALGQWSGARRVIATSLRLARQGGVTTHGPSLRALAELHRSSGRLARALHYEEKALAVWRQVGYAYQAADALQRMAQDHATLAHWHAAVACHKAMRAYVQSEQLRASRLRCRVAAVQRQSQRRQHEAAEQLQHLQRLAIVGRLIAQTHHALSTPIAAVHHLARELLGRPDSATQVQLLGALNKNLDRAGHLVGQLKLFSYRYAPQAFALSLHEALLGAWHGLGPHVGARWVDLDAREETPLQAWADPQRLGILFKVLLLELTQACRASLVRVRTRVAGENVVQLMLDAKLDESRWAASSASLGMSLCREIACEMGGTLRIAEGRDTPGPGLRCVLDLPRVHSVHGPSRGAP
jgi:signal transduction histidine kinase